MISTDALSKSKKAAGKAAADLIQSGMIVGLGKTGSYRLPVLLIA